jgi:hypothetical protein
VVYVPDDPNVQATAFTTPEGWLLPGALPRAKREAAPRTPREIVERRTDSYRQAHPAYHFIAYGPADEQLSEGIRQRGRLQRAQELPPIPRWLAACDARAVVFVPNGDILCFSPDPQSPVVPLHRLASLTGDWLRYSPQGELLGELRQIAAANWYDCYFPGRGELVFDPRVVTGQVVSDRTLIYNGTVMIVATQEGGFNHTTGGQPYEPRALEAYYYDGTPLELDAPLPDEHGLLYGYTFTMEQIRENYALQRELGLTS